MAICRGHHILERYAVKAEHALDPLVGTAGGGRHLRHAGGRRVRKDLAGPEPRDRAPPAPPNLRSRISTAPRNRTTFTPSRTTRDWPVNTGSIALSVSSVTRGHGIVKKGRRLSFARCARPSGVSPRRPERRDICSILA